MVSRIRDEDIASVREHTRIDEIVAQYVTLRPGGGGSMKGLCPFHDEKTPSFNVRPQVGAFHCFGCAAGGDVISFLRQIEGISFVEAVERLAERAGVQLRYADGGTVAARPEKNTRARLIEANKQAAQFYTEQLHTGTEAAPGRTFLAERGFDKAAAEQFGVGYAPKRGEALLAYLRGRGFSDEEIVAAGLAGSGNRGAYDRFRGRLVWPIRELSGDVVGFGARRLFDEDRIEAKYLNTPETSVFRKSQLLYGVDLARREIARRSQAVVVEGYTDVMACHLAGVPTAVATCGTAFGDDHRRVLRRLLLDHDEFRGEVIFTFDGDEAGQRAAVRAFEGDQQFAGRTYVAVESAGRDPCDLRLAAGDAAVRDLVARRVPLYRFVLTNIVAHYDLDRADGRMDALRATAPFVASVRDQGVVSAYVRELTRMLGLDDHMDIVRTEVSRAAQEAATKRATAPAGTDRRRQAAGPGAPTGYAPTTPAGMPLPDPADPRLAVEREVLRLVVQWPTLAGPPFDALDEHTFTHPAYVAIRQAVASAGGAGVAVGGESWMSMLGDKAADDNVRSLVSALAVEPLRSSGQPSEAYAASLVARVRELAVTRQIADLKSRLQRMNPVEQTEDYNRAFGELVALEQHRIALRERAAGGMP